MVGKGHGLVNTVCAKLTDTEVDRLDAVAEVWDCSRSEVLRRLVNGTGTIGATTLTEQP